MWFEASTAAWIGALFGAGIGVLGGTWGALAGVSASKGKRQRLVMGFGKVLLLAGILSLAVGAVALFTGQPRHVWYPFLLLGVLLSAGLLPGYLCVKKAYTQAAMRKMSVEDLG